MIPVFKIQQIQNNIQINEKYFSKVELKNTERLVRGAHISKVFKSIMPELNFGYLFGINDKNFLYNGKHIAKFTERKNDEARYIFEIGEGQIGNIAGSSAEVNESGNSAEVNIIEAAGDIAGSVEESEIQSQSDEEGWDEETVLAFEQSSIFRKNNLIEVIGRNCEINSYEFVEESSDSVSEERYMQYLCGPSYGFIDEDSTLEKLESLKELDHLRNIVSQLVEVACDDTQLTISLGWFWGYGSRDNRELEDLGNQIKDPRMTEKQVVDKMKRVIDLIYKGYNQISGFKMPDDAPKDVQKLIDLLVVETRKLGILNESTSETSR